MARPDSGHSVTGLRCTSTGEVAIESGSLRKICSIDGAKDGLAGEKMLLSDAQGLGTARVEREKVGDEGMVSSCVFGGEEREARLQCSRYSYD